MINKLSKVRLFINENLIEDKCLSLKNVQRNYLFNVLRLNLGNYINVFDGKNGEFSAQIININKKDLKIKIIKKIKEIKIPPDLWLIFCPLKKKYTDFIIKNATELGVRKIIPILSERTNNKNFRKDKIILNMIEALEQCEGTFLPEISDIITLESFLKNYDTERQLLFCNEKRNDISIRSILEKKGEKAGSILIGPEGGFNDYEIKMIKKTKSSFSVSLGPRVLRAETAATVAIGIWQSCLGDWNKF